MAQWKNRIVGFGTVSIDDIVPNPKNPKEHPEYQKQVLSGVLQEIGVVQTIVINKTTNHLVDGECRYFLAKDNGEKQLQVTFVELTEEEEYKVLLTFDETGTFARRNDERAAEIMKLITVKTDGMRDIVDRIARRLKMDDIGGSGNGNGSEDNQEDGEKDNGKEESYDSLISRWGVELGKIWTIKSVTVEGGYHRIMCGDAQNTHHVTKLIQKAKGSLVVTDPPYGVDFKLQKYNPRAKDWDEIKNDSFGGDIYRQWIKELMLIWKAHMNPDASYYIWTAAMNEAFMSFLGIEDAGIHIQSQIVWNKNAMVLGQADYQWKHENCWYGFISGSNHRWYGGRDQTTVWDITKVANVKYLHPMQKPIELYSIPIRNHTRTGDFCFDPFVGCGTQIIACESLGRLCFGMDIDPKWIAVSLERIHNELNLEISEL